MKNLDQKREDPPEKKNAQRIDIYVYNCIEFQYMM